MSGFWGRVWLWLLDDSRSTSRAARRTRRKDERRMMAGWAVVCFLACAGSVQAQPAIQVPCRFSFSTTLTMAGVSAWFDNRNPGNQVCTRWIVQSTSTGFSSVYWQLEGATDNAGAPSATIRPLVGTSGDNPNFHTGPYQLQATSLPSGGSAWVRIRLFTVGGTGSFSFVAYGFNPDPTYTAAAGPCPAAGALGSVQSSNGAGGCIPAATGLSIAVGTGMNNNVLGNGALGLNTTGNANNAFGFGALQSNTTGNQNTAIGFLALSVNTTGGNNVALGQNALNSTVAANENIAIGLEAGQNSVTGNDNVYLGADAGAGSNGSNNVAIGQAAGENETGDGNVFIGQNTGQGTAESGKLYVETNRLQDPSMPLIGGDFSARTVFFNARAGATPHTPASSAEACTAGQTASDVGFVYVCTATNTWKRAALSTF